MNELAMIAVNVFGGAVALDRAMEKRGWRRVTWVLVAAVLLTFAWGFSEQIIDYRLLFGCWPWDICSSTTPLRLPPIKGDRLVPHDQIIRSPWAVSRVA